MPKKQATVVCPACQGHGTISFSTDDVPCAACSGTGQIKATPQK
jgi:DnaJ-class molecular chaperone